jgi:hypothetical protein
MIEKEIADLGRGEVQLSQLSAEYIRKGKLEGAIGTLMGVLLIVAVYLMATKPGLRCPIPESEPGSAHRRRR